MRLAPPFFPRLLRHLLATGCVLLMLAPASQACEKTLRWNDDPPFSLKRADGTVAGIDVDINREVLRRLGCSVRLLEMPWARALQSLETGSLDILPGA